MPHAEKRLLVLWDVDHTLIDTGGLGRELYRRAFEQVTGRETLRQAEVTGRTEMAIFAETLALHDIEPSPQLERRYVATLARMYRDDIAELRLRGHALPGATDTLALLSEQPRIVQSVLTGNLRQVAVTKLAAFDLDRYVDFEVGAYGNDHSERHRLVALAQQRAASRTGQGFDRTNTVLIGDSLQDVLAGRDGGAQVIGVASGGDSAATLRKAGALAGIDSLVEWRPAAAEILARM